jgi:hypothetical protein
MRFLRTDQCADWCQGHGYQLPSQLGGHRSPESHAQHEFALPADAGQRVALCRLLWNLADSGPVTDRLLWINEWGVWPSSEHLPLFMRWRAGFGERRSLADAGGQLIQQGDDDDGLSVLIMACLFLWGCWMYSEQGMIVALSHDEGGVVYEPRNRVVPSRRAALAQFGVLIDPREGQS